MQLEVARAGVDGMAFGGAGVRCVWMDATASSGQIVSDFSLRPEKVIKQIQEDASTLCDVLGYSSQLRELGELEQRRNQHSLPPSHGGGARKVTNRALRH
jgi:hypothetical protein